MVLLEGDRAHTSRRGGSFTDTIDRDPYCPPWSDDASRRALAPGTRLGLGPLLGSPEIAPSAFIPDTNVSERLNEEFRRRVKTRARCPPRTPPYAGSLLD